MSRRATLRCSKVHSFDITPTTVIAVNKQYFLRTGTPSVIRGVRSRRFLPQQNGKTDRFETLGRTILFASPSQTTVEREKSTV
ncbi:hypothetical protein TNCV_3652641 [Trichonephila clavipes]|nr:hypothetical protein TNCV_3652641 [Trichonephila clavipes]